MDELLLGPTASARARLQAAISYDEPMYAKMMNNAIADDPAATSIVQNFMARTQQLLQGDCANAVNLGAVAETAAPIDAW